MTLWWLPSLRYTFACERNRLRTTIENGKLNNLFLSASFSPRLPC